LPVAPAAASTDVGDTGRGSTAHLEVSQHTHNTSAPNGLSLVEQLLRLVASEAEALLVGEDRDGRLADLNARLALASWDGLGEAEAAQRHLELAEHHPLVLRLQLGAAVTDADALAIAEARVAKLAPGPLATALAIELVEAWLLRHDRSDAAAALADRVLARELPASWRVHIAELADLAHAASGRWQRVLELRLAAHDPGGAPDEIAATAALVLDRGGDAAAAFALCWSAIERTGDATPATLGWLRVIDVALDAAARAREPRRLELLERHARLVAALSNGALEGVALSHLVAHERSRAGHQAEALALWTKLADEPAAALPAAGRRIALLAALREATMTGDRAGEIAARRRLVDSECAEVATAHAWRALELSAVAGAPPPDLVHAVFDRADGLAAERWVDLLDHGRPTTSTVARLEARGGLALRMAAAVAERLGNVTRAIELWRRAATIDGAIGTEHDHLIRLLRANDGGSLAEAYDAWSNAESDPRTAAALWCGRAIVGLVAADFVAAEECLQRARALDPKDSFCRAALATVYRAGKRYQQLAQVLSELATSLASHDARAAVTREYAELLDERLDDPHGARAALERMIGERPDDREAMVVLARLYDRDQQWPHSIDLRKRALALARDPEQRADLWVDIALSEERRGARDAALAALERAADAVPPRADVLREQARLHREAGNYERSLEFVRAELALDPPIARRAQLQMQHAQLLAALDREPRGVVAAYLDVLAIEPDHGEALAAIGAPARALGLWDELAHAFRGAPQTPHNLALLAEALEHIAAWAELAGVKRRQLDQAPNPVEKTRLAMELAHVYQHQLHDIDAAIQMLKIAHTSAPDDRQVPILLELGQLSGAEDAANAYEAVLEREPRHAHANVRLESLYEQLGRDRDLSRLLEARAEHEAEPATRALLLARIAELRASSGDIDGAIATYTTAFATDPANRDVFTRMEVVFFQAERWAAAMHLYDLAIAHVEGGASRSYRLGDLYARRGNVQLNFLGQIEPAIASYQKVIEVESLPSDAAQILEQLCARRGDWAPLIEAWERRAEVQYDPNRQAEALRTGAKLAAERGDPHTAMRLQRKLLALEPADAVAGRRLERYYEDQQDRTALIDVLKSRLRHARDHGESIELLKRIARVSEEGARDVDTAVEHYRKVLELEPENREALDALSRIYESTEQWAEFLDVTRRLIKVTSDRSHKALLYFKCGSVMEAKFGREQDAIRYYDAAIKTSPNCMPAVHGLRDLYRRREEWTRVIETLEVEVKLWVDDKERAGVFAQIGRIYEKQLADPARAMEYYDSALSVDPECVPANQSLFDHYFERGEWEQASPVANALAQKAMREGDPTTRSEFYRKRGVVARMTGDPRAAADSFVVALELKPTNGAALDDLGELAREDHDAWDFESTYRELEKIYKKRDDAGSLLARVYVGRAATLEREGDLDGAATLYGQALELAPTDFKILSALVDFHADMRHWREAIAAIRRFADGAPSREDRVAALMRQASIHADSEMDAPRAIDVLHQVIELAPQHQGAHYLLAQEYFLIGHFAHARTAIDRVIDLATQPGQELIPEALARYYYYRGRTLEAAGDTRAAAPQYRRAIEYDPGYAPPALVLARRAAETGDQRQAETLLLDTAHAAMAQGGQRAAVPLQRGIARMLLLAGDRPAAIEAYRGILAVEPDGASDRVALAEIYAVDDPARAIAELRKVIDRDIHHAPAYRLLASFYNRTGDFERAHRVLTALDLLGFAEPDDRVAMQQVRASRNSLPLRRGLDDSNRERLLLTSAAREPLGDLWSAFAEPLSARLAPPSLGENLASIENHGDARLIQLATEISTVYQLDVEVFVGERVPGLFAMSAFPRRLLVVDRALLGEPEPALRFLFGCAYEAIRGGYAVLLQLGARQRRELALLLRALLSDPDPDGPAAELLASATPRETKVLERHSGTLRLDPGAWIDGMLASAKRAGLVACDDFAAAIWMVARLAGEKLASHDETVALGAVLGGPDLVKFYLSDSYQLIRDLLAPPA
jgi:tetratricopeptide (TPR) repeat protein